jgi:hypothetical protein
MTEGCSQAARVTADLAPVGDKLLYSTGSTFARRRGSSILPQLSLYG